MAKIQAHNSSTTAKQINQIQDKPYVITQKQVQQQHFQKLKVRKTKRTHDQREEKSPLTHTQSQRTILFSWISLTSLTVSLTVFQIISLTVESSESKRLANRQLARWPIKSNSFAKQPQHVKRHVKRFRCESCVCISLLNVLSDSRVSGYSFLFIYHVNN